MHLVEQGSTFTLMRDLPYVASFLNILGIYMYTYILYMYACENWATVEIHPKRLYF